MSVFMGVPTMYAYLLDHCNTRMDDRQRTAARYGCLLLLLLFSDASLGCCTTSRPHHSAAARRLRLAVSGSAACPMDVMHRWEELTGQVLLERYGMSETGMILSNPLMGERRPGCVGLPLPGVEIAVEPPGGATGAALLRPCVSLINYNTCCWFHYCWFD